MNPIYKVLIIGLGNIGMLLDIKNIKNDIVQSHIKSFSINNSFEIMGAVDIDEKNLKILENRYGIKGYKEVEIAISECNPDVIVIATPTENHYSIIKKITNSNLSHYPKLVLCEKPLAYSFKESKAIVEILKNKQIKLYVNYMRRVDKGVLKIKDLINSGKIEPPIQGICLYTKGIFNNASHLVNLLEYWFGKCINVVRSSEEITKINYDFECDFILGFKNANFIFKSLNNINYTHLSIDFFAKNNAIRYQKGGRLITLHSLENDDIYDGYKILNNEGNEIKNSINKIQKNVTDEILKILNSKPSNLCTGDEALSSLDIIRKI